MAVVKSNQDWRDYVDYPNQGNPSKYSGLTDPGYDPNYGVYQLPSGGTYQPFGNWEAEYPWGGSQAGQTEAGGGGLSMSGLDPNRYGSFEDVAKGGKITTTGAPRGSIQTTGTTARPTGSVTTQRTTFAGEMPTLDLREMDKRRVKALTQKALAPRLRQLRSALERALVRSYENPNVRRMIVRGALEGYGQSIEEARAGAERFGLQEEAAERATTNQELIAAYNAAMEKYRSSGVTTTTRQETYGSEGTTMAEGGIAAPAMKGRYAEQQAARTSRRIVGGRLI